MARKGTRKQLQRFDHRNRAAQLYLRGKTQEQIAAELGIDRSTVSRDIKKVEQWLRDDSVENLHEERRRAMAEVIILKETYWDGYESSQKPKERSKAVKTKNGQSGVERAEKQTETRVGETKYLDGVLRARQELNKLMGLYAPQMIAPTTPRGEGIYDNIDIDPASLPAQLAGFVTAIAAATGLAGAVDFGAPDGKSASPATQDDAATNP